MLVTISDKKIGVDANSDGIIDYYNADVITASDYFPFGSLLPGRQYGTKGRYGFNGKENDNEVKGEGNQQDYGMRIYDPRVGRFLSVDPITKEYPELTPYQFASNKPINSIDLDGLESKEVYQFYNAGGKLTYSNSVEVKNPYNLGSGILYHIYTIQEVSSEQINAQTVQVQQRTIQNHLYIPPPKSILEKIGDFLSSKVPQVMVFGSGRSLSDQLGGKPDYSKPLYSFNFKELSELTELISAGMETSDLKGAESEKVPELTKKLFDAVADDNPGSPEAQKLKETNGTQPSEKPVTKLLPETNKRRDSCTVCGNPSADSSHYNKVVRAVNEQRKKEQNK